MARDYGKISTSIWRSKKFRSVCDNDRLFYMYLHTCPHVNSVGCFVLPIGYIQADLGWSSEAIEKSIKSLSEAYLIAYNKAEELVRIIDFVEHDPFTNEKHATGAVRIALALPDCDEKLHLLNELSKSKWNVCTDQNGDLAKAIDSLSEGYCPEPEPEPEPEPDNNSTFENSERPPAPEKHTPDDYQLAEEIFTGVSTVAPKTKKPNLSKWADCIRLMREQDGHTLQEIRQVFLFANTHHFWSRNILSPGKLRDQFPRLHSEMLSGGRYAHGNGNSGRQSTVDRQRALADQRQRERDSGESGQGAPDGPVVATYG